MPSYIDQLNRQMEAAGTVKIQACPLETPPDHPLREKGMTAILTTHCVCVTDPCPCADDDNIIVWIPESSIQRTAATEKKNRNGDALSDYLVSKDAEIITETFTHMKAGDFHTLKARSSGRGGPVGKTKYFSSGSIVCAGNTLYYVREGADGAGGTMFEYIAIGSCETLQS